MLDIKYIRNNSEKLKKAISDKRIDLDLDELLRLDDERLKLMQEKEKLQGEKNDLNDKMSAADDSEKKRIIEQGREIKDKIDEIEPQYKKIVRDFNLLMVKVPTVPSLDTPFGKNDEDNVEFYKWGKKPEFNFTPKDHIELGKGLDILDLDRGKKVAGFRGYYLKNEGAQLVMALMFYALNKMVQKGFSPMIPPTLIKEFALYGSGYFKGLEYDDEVDEIYQVSSSDKEADGAVAKDKKFLVGTAEPSLLAYYADEILNGKDLPIRLAGYSPCYRSEIGSYGKDVKGMYRVHEFFKVEQVILCKADEKEAEKLQEEMVAVSKEMHEELGLPYRQLKICTGDLSPGKYRQYDIEAWLPGSDRYGETGSASIFCDWQARRLNVRYTDENGERKFVYMLNNTALPSPRILIAILENYQQEDGSVAIPKVLQGLVGKDVIRPKRKVD